MVYYAVIDTNVLVSALLTRHEDASPLQVVKRLFRGDIIPLYDEEIVGEYAEVLRRPKFHFSETLIRIPAFAFLYLLGHAEKCGYKGAE